MWHWNFTCSGSWLFFWTINVSVWWNLIGEFCENEINAIYLCSENSFFLSICLSLFLSGSTSSLLLGGVGCYCYTWSHSMTHTHKHTLGRTRLEEGSARITEGDNYSINRKRLVRNKQTSRHKLHLRMLVKKWL